MAKKTYEELLAGLSKLPDIFGGWVHYKGGRYVADSYALLEKTLEPLVLYRPYAKAFPVFARPLSEWEEMVEHDGKQVPRFRRES